VVEVKLTDVEEDAAEDQPVNEPEYVPPNPVPIALVVAPALKEPKALATCVAVNAEAPAVKVKFAIVTELPAANALKVMDDCS
jgi:hypothetical protein